MIIKSSIISLVLMLSMVTGSSTNIDSKYFSTLPSTLNTIIEKMLKYHARFDELCENEDWGTEYHILFQKINQDDPLLKNQIKELSPSLIGVEIPIEVSAGLPLEISKTATISDIATPRKDYKLEFQLDFSAILTEDIKLTRSDYYSTYEITYFKFVDKEGNIIKKDSNGTLLNGPGNMKNKITLEAGQEMSGTILYEFNSNTEVERGQIEENKRLATLEKIIIISKEEYDQIKNIKY